MELFKILPSLAALKDNVRYKIRRGNEKKLFSLHQKHGISSLHLRRKIRKNGVHNIRIDGIPIRKKEVVAGNLVKLDKLKIWLEVDVLY
ncbi:hypothetical protein KUTeg_017959 [Tegillarca granosa]|uniref:Uncharacterized protein n=1 Tax=Tegillarca granosa TaxID=220873 RepID=A0ABQ9EKG9_TEGGR|nr:hypothetical protein KUTeg_017959 [Tegillarca granosa]